MECPHAHACTHIHALYVLLCACKLQMPLASESTCTCDERKHTHKPTSCASEPLWLHACMHSASGPRCACSVSGVRCARNAHAHAHAHLIVYSIYMNCWHGIGTALYAQRVHCTHACTRLCSLSWRPVHAQSFHLFCSIYLI